MMLGSAIFVSAFIVIVRLKAFEKEFAHVVRSALHSAQQSARQSFSNLPAVDSESDGRCQSDAPPARADAFELNTGVGTSSQTDRVLVDGVNDKTPENVTSDSASIKSSIDLTNAERQELGGSEYEVVLLLSYLVPIYFVAWQLLSSISCAWWVAAHRPEITRANGLNPWWTGAFNAVSAFNNNGMSLLDANMVSIIRTTLATLD